MNDGHKRQGQKHQNKSAFKIMFNPLALDTHKKVSYRGLCKRCAEQIEWKVKYNKYKKMAEAAKCNYCHQKNVFRTYMRACDACSESNQVCPKCLDHETEEQTQIRLNQLEQKQQQMDIDRKMNEYIKTLKERSRRTVRRLLEKGTASWDKELNTYVDEEGKPLPLQFRHGYGEDSKDSQNDQEEEIDEFGDGSDSGAQSDDEDQREEKQIKDKKSSEAVNQKANQKANHKKNKKNGKNKQQDGDEAENNDSDDKQESIKNKQPTEQKIGQTPLKQETSKQQVTENDNNDEQDWVDDQQDEIDVDTHHE